MSESIFNVTLDDITSVEWENEIKELKFESYYNLKDIFDKKTNELRESGEEKGAQVYKFLSAVTSLSINNDNPETPFHPFFTSPQGRSAAIDDFTDEKINIFEKLIDSTQNAMMKARFADVVYVRANKEFPYAKIASESYLKSLVNLEQEHIFKSESRLRRGFSLSQYFGRTKSPFTDYTSFVQELINERFQSEKKAISLRLIELLLDMGVAKTETSKYIELSEDVADRLKKNKNHSLAQKYYDLVIRILSFNNEQDSVKKIQKKKGECYVNEANSWLNNTPSGYMMASNFLAQAVECFRRAGESEETIKQHHINLLNWQKKGTEASFVISEKMDITEFVKASENHVREKTIFDAIRSFAFGHPPTKRSDIEAQVKENIKKFPLLHFFSASFISDDGKVLENKPSIMSDKPEKQKEALEASMFNSLRFNLQMRAQGYIEPGRQVIYHEHRPSVRDLLFLVLDNPFISPGHEEIFLSGIHAGFKGDFLVASHLLVPQIEESIRYVLKSNGFITSNLHSDLTQNEKLSGTLLSRPETIDIFGEDLVFELRGLLCENSCYAFRNRLAHGFVSTNECYGFAAYNLWWIVIRLCAYPVFTSTQNR